MEGLQADRVQRRILVGKGGLLLDLAFIKRAGETALPDLIYFVISRPAASENAGRPPLGEAFAFASRFLAAQ
jgi:hypothetical protein